ncbi:sulfurtransferase complex subunit TusB [Pseudoalteromonas mariniglutinosa]|uniref:sulfurtransferase complex subunit TusB n=1 Tax=Pseudoalteromonas mariniglutinosa TaxID=206042 RepID=UPI00384D618D
MSTLHIFTKPVSQYNANMLENLIKAEDNILLVSDACYCSKQFRQFSAQLHLLAEDASARGIAVHDNDIVIDYTAFVDLTLTSNNTISW